MIFQWLREMRQRGLWCPSLSVFSQKSNLCRYWKLCFEPYRTMCKLIWRDTYWLRYQWSDDSPKHGDTQHPKQEWLGQTSELEVITLLCKLPVRNSSLYPFVNWVCYSQFVRDIGNHRTSSTSSADILEWYEWAERSCFRWTNNWETREAVCHTSRMSNEMRAVDDT